MFKETEKERGRKKNERYKERERERKREGETRVNQKYQEEPESIIIRRSTSGVRNFLCNDRQRGKSRVSAVSARGENKREHVRGKEGKRETYLLQVSLVTSVSCKMM